MSTSDQTTNGDALRQWLRHPHSHTPLVFYTILILLTIELATVFVAPIFVPDHFYLRRYLRDAARQNTTQFLADEDEYMIRDEITGWRNRPNSGDKLWSVDEYGSRTTHPFTTVPSKPLRVLLLGSSLINGGHVDINQTISAQLEDSCIEALNFGTMLFSIDQAHLDYKYRLHQFGPKVVVVGISASPHEGLESMYVPFRSSAEVNMPYLKPRFRLASDTLEFIPLPDRDLHQNIFDDSRLLAELKQNDAFYPEFAAYKRLGLGPVSFSIWQVYVKARNFLRLVIDDPHRDDLLKAVMTSIVDEARSHGAEVIFLALPDMNALMPGGVRKYLPDNYGRMVADLKNSGFHVLDIRDIFRACGLNPRALIWKDNFHFTPDGNRVIADALREELSPFVPSPPAEIASKNASRP